MSVHEIPKMPVAEVYESKAQKMYYIVPIGVNQHVFDNLMSRLDAQS
jgi:hypothetical protein